MSGVLAGAALVAGGVTVVVGGSWAGIRSLNRLSREERRARRIEQLEAAKKLGKACLFCGKRNPTIPVYPDGALAGWSCDDHPIRIPEQNTDPALDALLRQAGDDALRKALDLDARRAAITGKPPIVLMTGGHDDDSLCYAMPADGDLCKAAATTYVETVDLLHGTTPDGTVQSAAVLTRVCDPHLAALRASYRYEITHETPLGDAQ